MLRWYAESTVFLKGSGCIEIDFVHNREYWDYAQPTLSVSFDRRLDIQEVSSTCLSERAERVRQQV